MLRAWGVTWNVANRSPTSAQILTWVGCRTWHTGSTFYARHSLPLPSAQQRTQTCHSVGTSQLWVAETHCRHFQMYAFIFVSISLKFVPEGWNWRWTSIGVGNGLALKGITWNKDAKFGHSLWSPSTSPTWLLSLNNIGINDTLCSTHCRDCDLEKCCHFTSENINSYYCRNPFRAQNYTPEGLAYMVETFSINILTRFT